MARVVIVDDEKLVLYGIRSYLLGTGERHQVVGLFTSGEEALLYCRSHPPDVVLTDIKMPGMDGLELIATLKAEAPQIKVVVLSCHDEYDLVRKAFTRGADEYLLKHEVEQAELMALLDRLSKETQARSGPRQAGGTLLDAAAFFAPFPQRIPPERVAEIRAVIRETGLRLTAEPLLPAVVMFRDEYTEDFRLIPWSYNRSMIGQIVQDCLAASGCGEVFELHAAEFLCLFEFPLLVRPSKHAALAETLDRVLRSIGRYCNRQVFIGVADGPCEIAALGEGVLAADRALEMRFYHAAPSVLYDDKNRTAAEASGTESEARFRAAHPLCFAPEMPVDEIERALEGYLAAVRCEPVVRPRVVRSTVAMAFRQYLSQFQAVTGRETEGLAATEYADLLEILSHADSWALFERAARELMLRIRRFCSNVRKEKAFAAAVRAFLQEHYREDLQLSAVAQRFHMTVGHFCETFRRELGSTFVETLNQMRVSRAKALLLATDKPAKEIARLVGYRNPNYFSRVFKRYAGCTAKEFRDRSCQAENSE